MKFLKLCVVSLAVLSQITVYASLAPYVVVESKKSVSTTRNSARSEVLDIKSDYSALIEKYALKWQISPVTLNYIIKCESSYNRYAVNNTQGVEFSVGLAQINLLAHNITREQAEDPDFAINFMAKNLSEGHWRMWYTCYTQLSTSN